MTMKRKLLIVLLTTLLLTSTLPLPSAHAFSIQDLNNGDVLDLRTLAEPDNMTINVPPFARVTIIGDPNTTYTEINIVCGDQAQLTLCNVNITNNNSSVISFFPTGCLILYGDNHLEQTYNSPAIFASNHLEITGEGRLLAKSKQQAAISAHDSPTNSIEIMQDAKVSAVSEDSYGIMVNNIQIEGVAFIKGRFNDITGNINIDASTGALFLANDKPIVMGANASEITLNEDGIPLAAGSKLNFYMNDVYNLDVTLSQEGMIYGYLGARDYRFTKDNGAKRTEDFSTNLFIDLSFTDALGSDRSIDVQGTFLDKNANPYEDLVVSLYSTPQYQTTDYAGEFAFTAVPLRDHNIFLTKLNHRWMPLKLHFTVGDNFSWSQSGNDLSITVPEGVISVDITMTAKDTGDVATSDVTGTEPTVSDVTVYSPSDNPHTGER